jgi:hypothetical protein
MKHAVLSGKVLLGLGLGLLLPACGKSDLGISTDAARDTTNAPGEPPVADTPPFSKDALPTTMPDLPNIPDLPPSDPALAPDLRPSDPVQQPELAPLGDVPGDPVAPADPADARIVDGDLLDTNQQDRAGPPDLVAELPVRYDATLDLSPRDLGGPNELPSKPDSTITLDEGPGLSYYCTSTGGTVETRQCCSGTSYFFDTCNTAVGACGCSPSNSVAIQMCSCPSPSCFLPGYGCVGPGSTCTVGMDQTCNDNPAFSSVRGHCIGGGRCVCGTAGMSPTSGKCL